MKMQHKSPKDFGIRVRQDPDVLQITATNKMRSSEEMELTFSDRLKETWCFRRDVKIFKSNFDHTVSFLNSLGLFTEKNGQSYVWYNTGNSQDVIQFLTGYIADDRLEHEKLIEYIEAQSKIDFLTNWTIVLINNKDKKDKYSFPGNDSIIPVGLTMRRDANAGKGNFYEISRSHIIDPMHEFVDIDTSSPDYVAALDETISDWSKSERKNKRPEEPVFPSGRNIRAHRKPTEGLLLIYPLDPKPEGWKDSSIKEPIIGYAISFPKNENDKKIKYRVNQVFMDEYGYDDEPEFREEDLA
jgi:hypothetical protein